MSSRWEATFRELLLAVTGRAGIGHGFGERVVRESERRVGARLPDPLRAYYLSVGRHPINRVHNRLWSPDEWAIHADMLVFMEENQGVVYWGVRERTRTPDPVVYQSTDPGDGDWYAEARCSRFLAAMLCWQAVSGGLRWIGYSDPVESKHLRRLGRTGKIVGRIGELSAFVVPGGVVCSVADGDNLVLHVGARNQRDFVTFPKVLGLPIHEA